MHMMCIIVFPYIQNYSKINKKLLLLGKVKIIGFGKGVTNKGFTTKPIQSQPNTMGR